MKCKRLLSMTLALCMMFGSAAMLPENVFTDQTEITASADSSSESDFEYSFYVEDPYGPIDTDYVVINKYNGSASSLTIPAELGGKKVKRILYRAFEGNETIKDLTISDGIEQIDYFSFENCINLESVKIPGSVKLISDSLFYGCTSLKSVTIANGVEKIGSWSFWGCSALKSITIPSSVTALDYGAFSECSNLSEINIPKSVTKFGAEAFSGTKWLEEQRKKDPLVIVNDILIDAKTCSGKVVIPKGVKEIGRAAFWDDWNSKITEVVIPSGVTTIGEEAFRCCSNLTSVILPDTLKFIKQNAFGSCDSLTSIVLPDGLEEIGDSAFQGSLYFKSVNIPKNASIGSFAFTDTKWFYDQINQKPLVIFNKTLISAARYKEADLTIPDSVTRIAGGAFLFNNSTKNVVVPESVTDIGDSAFDCCENLESVSLPDSITSMGGAIFINCHNLKKVNIPKNITEIGPQMFQGCSIEQITIPDGVVKIGNLAFEGCKKLKGITIPDSVKEIESSAFMGCESIKSITIPKSVSTIGEQAFGFKSECDENTGLYIKNNEFKIYCYKNSAGEDYALNNGFDHEYLSYFDYTTLKDGTLEITKFVGEADELNIPSKIGGKTVTSIGENAFNRGAFKKIIIPDTVTKIGDQAFGSCTDLTDITLPDSIKDIGKWTFYGCKSLKSVKIPASLSVIGESVFYGCSALSSVTIPKTVETIGNMAFYDCKGLKSVSIQNGVKSVEPAAFLECDSLTSISIPESVANIGNNAFGYSDKLTKINVDKNNKNYSSVDGVLYNKDKTELIACPTARTQITFPKSLKRICLCAMNGCKLKSVVIPEGVTKIENQTFAYCPDLTEVVIPSSVTMIDEKAFVLCENLKKITIPDSVTSIGQFAFSDCKALESITIPSSITDFGWQAFSGTKWLEEKQKADPLVVVNGVLIDGTTFKKAKLSIPKAVAKINYGAFTNCTEIKTVMIPGYVNEIGEAAFDCCKNITSVTLESGITKVEPGAFYGCENLKEITIPSSINKIGTMAFGFIFDPDNFSKKPIEGFKIYCYKDTVGEKYAVDNRFEYCCLNVTITDKGGKFDPETIKESERIVISAPSGSDAVKYAKKNNIDYVEISPDDDKKGFSGNVDNKVINNIANNKKELSISDSQMTAVFDTKAVGEIVKNAGDKGVRFNYDIVDKTDNAAQQTVIDEASRYGAKIVDLNLTDKDGKSIKFASDKSEGKVTLTIPYKPKKKNAAVKVFYIDEKGNKTDMNALYDSINKCVCFTTNHFSIYSIEDEHEHTYGDWKLTTKPTCTEKGVETRVCSVCKKAETRETDALGHNYADTIVKPTCTAKGYTLHKCSRCADKYKDTETDMIPHTFGEWKTVSFDVAKGTSTQKHTCTVCGKEETQITKKAVTRLAGSNRFLTAVEISKASFDKADTVILAFGLNYADALAGVPLATKLNAPILLTAKDTLPDVTLAEINRLGAKKVIILGGTSAISEKVEKTLKTNKLKTERIAGKTRFGTATAIAEKLNQKPTDVFFVYGLNYADALSVGGIAAAKNAPIIYLTTKGELNADTAAYLAKIKGKVKNAYIIGGEGVISNAMMKNVAKALGLTVNKTVQRVAGANRYETCVAVNNKFKSVLSSDGICVAKGLDFPDALAGGVYAAKTRQALFLADGKKLLDCQNTYLKGKNAAKITVFGGTNAVPDSLVKLIAKASI